jgi:ribose transport system ATP-binding protein
VDVTDTNHSSSTAADLGVVVEHVSKAFGETRALSDCSLRARTGEIHAIVGENGSGKSTLAKILSGVIHADHGTVSVFGVTPKTPWQARRLGIATIFQEILVASEATVTDNLFVGSDGFVQSSVSSSQKREIAADLMQRFALANVNPDAVAGSLPLNIKQWLVIARALLTRPRLLILDESSAALDLDATNRLHVELRRLRDDGSAIIIVTHRIAELIRITNRATVLRDGHAIGELAAADINEHNLLTMMTPPARLHQIEKLQRDHTPRKHTSQEAMAVSGLRVKVGGPSFDLALWRGEILGVTGLDGQGQDNLIRLVSGIGLGLGGSVTVTTDETGPQQLKSLSDAESLGVSYVSGDRKREGIFPNLSIFENLAIALYRTASGPIGWLTNSAVAAYAAEVKRFSIKAPNRNALITSLSGGNQQKILLGRAFARSAKIIVLNDPARGIDLGTKTELYDELRKFVAGGGTVIYLSSEIEEFLGFADRVAVFRDGAIFRVLEGEDVNEETMLAAMFGHVGPVVFDNPAHVNTR